MSNINPDELLKPKKSIIVKNRKYYFKTFGIPVIFAAIAILIVLAISIIAKAL